MEPVKVGESLWEHPLATGMSQSEHTEESLTLSSGHLQSSWEIRGNACGERGVCYPRACLHLPVDWSKATALLSFTENPISSWVVVARAFNPSTQAEARNL